MADSREQRKSVLGQVARTGALIGGGVYAYRNRAAISRTLSSVTSNTVLTGSRMLGRETQLMNSLSDMRILLTGLSDSLGDNPSIRRTIRAGYDEQVANKMRENFEVSIRNNIKKRHEMMNRPGGTNQNKFASTFYRDFHQTQTGGLSQFQYAATQAFRQNTILQALRTNAVIQQHGGEHIINALTNYHGANKGIFIDPNKHVSEFTKQLEAGMYKHKVRFDDTTRANFQRSLMNTIQPYSGDAPKLYRNAAFKNQIDHIAGKMETATAAEFIKNAVNSTSLISKSLNKRGFQATTLRQAEGWTESQKRRYGLIIDDFDSDNNKKSVDMTLEMRKFLNDHRSNTELHSLLRNKGVNFSFDDMVLDPLLFTHHTTGEILDNRHLKEGLYRGLDSFQESVKTPFLNINPLDLTPWQSLRSGQLKEGLHVLSAGQTHAYLRGMDGHTFEDFAKDTYADGIRKSLSNSSHFYTGGSVYRVSDVGNLELVDENLYLSPSQFGAFSRMHKNHLNYSEKETVDERGWFKRFLDIGHQEGESHYEAYKKAIGKFSDEMYGPNALKSMVYNLHADPAHQADQIRQVYGMMSKSINKNATLLNREAVEVLSDHINGRGIFGNVQVNGEAFDFTRLSDDDYLVDALMAFNKAFDDNTAVAMHKQFTRKFHQTSLQNRITDIVDDPSVTALKQWGKSYKADPVGTMSSREMALQKKLPTIFDTMVPQLGEDEALIPAADRIRRSFHQYALRALDADAGDFSTSYIRSGTRKRSSLAYLQEARDKGFLSDLDIQNAKDLELLTDLQAYSNMFDETSRPFEAKTFLDDIMRFSGADVIVENNRLVFQGAGPTLTNLGVDLQEGIRRAQPILGRAPELEKPSLNGSDFIIMRKTSMAEDVKKDLASINYAYLNQPVNDGWDLAINGEQFVRDAAPKTLSAGKRVIQELFSGRHMDGTDSLDNVSTVTGIVYGLAERLDNQFTNFGLGLSRKNLGTFQSIIGNQYLRRIVLPFGMYQQAVYLDGLTGDNISDGAADAYVTGHETLQTLKDITGINKLMRPWAKVFQNAGLDQVNEWVGVKQLDFLTMGAFTDFRSADDVREYYESGEDPVRKNRYWGVGSPTPWAGSGIDYYRPNWYRTMKSDYKFTDTMYGSESEYWANNWMPTLTHPFSPIKHFVTDPYHWEDKHEIDRPYAVTGGFSEIQNIPIVGSLIDGTVGRILKPRREHEGLAKAHREYLASINEYIQQQYDPTQEGAYVGVKQGGGISLYDMYGSQGTWGGINPIEPVNGQIGSGPTYGAGAGGINYGNFLTSTFKTQGATGGVIGGGYGALGGNGGNGLGSGRGFEQTKKAIALQNYELAVTGKGYDTPSISAIQKLNNRLIPESIGDLERLDSLQNMATDTFYSMSELSGIYGFMTKTALGYSESWRGVTLAPSTLMTSPNRAFWDMSLGGMGGALSEIGRRYMPRDPNKNYYSPIRNTMPDWLPGIENGMSLDFLHGDPYTKVKQGEMRLPGKSYETLYKLHPDGTGAGEWANYGIFDRFRILADVDPDSDQFKISKHEVSLLRQSGGMTDEMEREFDEITDQVRNKQDTMRWYDKKFSYADIDKQTVTVTKIIDPNTFMVREFDSPVRLAGVKLTKKDNEDAIEWLGQYVKPGAKLKIGIAENPADRYNKDTYETLSAVVYTNKNEEGRFFFETNKGQSLNALLANRTWKNPVKIKDDGSPTATRALYSNDMVTVGKWMETMTHDILPKVPFVGVLADKFLQVRTPIESYKREQVYSSDWRPWTAPYESWIKPMLNTVSSQNPLLAGAELAALGHLWGKTRKMTGLGKVGGFFLGAGLASWRVLTEAGEDLIPGADGVNLPQERVREREINEYFDRLKYVKYKGLYEQARRLAQSEEGVDVNEFFDAAAEKGRANKGLKRFITAQKKILNLAKKTGYGDIEAIQSKLDELNDGIESIDSDKHAYKAGKYSSLAVKYRKEYEGTLYGMDGSSGDRTALMRALTPKEREYVPRFLETTNARDRKEILKYVPKDIKRILQGSWGMKADRQESVENYFRTHYLPDESWAGWGANVNLDDMKIKVMKKEKVNPTSSGYWAKDQERAERQGEKAIPIHSLSSMIDVGRLREVLQGSGLSNVEVQLTKQFGKGPGGIQASIDLMHDARDEIVDTINESAHSLF